MWPAGLYFCFFFFFSSRRRHTRWNCDWSSDVCSSDLNDILFDYLDDFCTAYLDDILIYSDNELEHKEHVQRVIKRLQKAGLQADIKKSEFSVKRTKYLGFIISTNGIETDLEKTSVID